MPRRHIGGEVALPEHPTMLPVEPAAGEEADSEEGEESLSTSERAIIQAEKAEDKTTSSTEPVKKRGRKPKTKE